MQLFDEAMKEMVSLMMKTDNNDPDGMVVKVMLFTMMLRRMRHLLP